MKLLLNNSPFQALLQLHMCLLQNSNYCYKSLHNIEWSQHSLGGNWDHKHNTRRKGLHQGPML